MHMKEMYIDEELSGSYNYTDRAADYNLEHLTVMVKSRDEAKTLYHHALQLVNSCSPKQLPKSTFSTSQKTRAS